MTIQKIGGENNSTGSTGANHYAYERWRGEINGKQFEVSLNSMAAPAWEGADLDEDERNEVMAELTESSSI